ncbi:Cytochrome c mitochondrial import factor CYC2 [Colletotrichum trifolii]|uniref:Cytochrome c mitochondrial import factor CYC2 n=1 Tax=Colletotrichum trifolii TaxID=5466 RepID=A0A4R8RQ73_COLTR|nr:Cytochrome c mitochondrial import factor CYC2 [Colletotrichum trifolii]
MASAAVAACRSATRLSPPQTRLRSSSTLRNPRFTIASSQLHTTLRPCHQTQNNPLRRLQPTHATSPKHHLRLISTSRPRRRTFISPRHLPILLLLAGAGAAWDSQWLFPTDASSSSSSSSPSETTVLANARKFVPFSVVAREQVSPTSFILTLKPPPSSSRHAPLSHLWSVFDLWCVEVKQPQIQVAREYTPLPPTTAAAAADDDETLRLYVRALRGGEVSTYLSALRPGADTVHLRGPHGEFDLLSRLGAGANSGRRVVFLAGGTGVASALQAARAVLSRPDAPVSMTIFWAVRSRSEIQAAREPKQPAASSRPMWGWFSAPRGGEAAIQAEQLDLGAEGMSPVARELLALKKRYGARLDVRVVVDEEGSRIQRGDIAAALTSEALLPRVPTTTTTEECGFHSQAAHVGMVDGAPNAGRRSLFKDGDCACSKDGPTGKNLFVVSGPEGFVQAYAGPKIWRDGGQLQGPVGGELGALQRSNPNLLEDWIVLKL